MILQIACPFCKLNVGTVVKADPVSRPGVQVQCTNCGARGPVYYTEIEAVDAWNRGMGGEGGKALKFAAVQLGFN
ncbi:MAG: Lar family restriction alleviation protein [Candidatus Hydrogenedentes bacterium]|nr:Lar family restriction alleviation protein [Candidatus Hydrogenedentota bacterium]